jgi:sugar lactone lactonase YvrE
MNGMSKPWLGGAAALATLVAAALYTRDAETRVASEVIAIEGRSGAFVESSRTAPASDALLYWADAEAGAIRRCDLICATVEDVVTDAGIPYGVAFDASAQALLWTDAAGESVRTLALGGGKPRALAASFEEPYAIDVSSEENGIVYYAVSGPIVHRIRLDQATGEENSESLLILDEAQTIHGLALDAEREALYVGDENGRMTHRIDLAAMETQRLAVAETEMPPGQTPKGGGGDFAIAMSAVAR